MKFDFCKVNPVVKVFSSIVFTFMQIFVCSFCAKISLMLFAVVIALFLKSKIVVNFNMILSLVILSFLSSFMCGSGRFIFEFGFIKISDDFLMNFSTVLISMLTFCVFSCAFLSSISPSEVSYVVSLILSPFKKFNVNVDEISIISTLAIRFMPVIMNESKKIIVAQESRGANITKGSIFKRIKYIVPVFIPIFTSCFRRALNVSLAMESRCYGAPFKRTILYENKFGLADLVLIILVLISCCGVLCCNFIKII